MKEMLCEINHALADLAHEQLSNLDKVDTREMEKVIHMIKNISEALYYQTMTETKCSEMNK